MKKTCIISLILILSLFLSTPVAPVTAVSEENLTVSAGCSTLNAQVPLGGTQQKVETAKAVVLYELNTDTLLYAYNADMTINPTGLVKLLSALVAIENGNLDDEVTVRRSVLDTVAIGSVSANLKAGEIITVRDLLYCVMVASANDAAAVLADYIGGSQAIFAQMLNARAEELGCTASNFTNAHGLADENQYATARDLAIITEAALENELFSEMFCAKDYTVPATNLSGERKLNTTNYMMSDAVIQTQVDERVTGGKPAAATTTDRSMICTAEVGTSRYLCVVMSASAEVSADGLSVTRWNIFEEVSFLLDFGFANFAVRQISDQNQAMYQYTVSDGASDVILRPSQSISVVLPLGFSKEDLQYHNIVDAALLTAPIEKGDRIGTMQIQYGSVYVGQCDLIAMNAVTPDGTTILDAERIELPEEVVDVFNWRPVLIWICAIVGGLLVLTVAALILVRVVNNAKLRAQHRRRARERRRNRS